MYILFRFFLLAVCAVPLAAQDNCDGRYETDIFPQTRFGENLEYGRSTGFDGLERPLLLDLYEPVGDMASARPLVVMMHGGVFRTGDKQAERFPVWGPALARRGYVAVSINYRLGIEDEDNPITYLEAAVRALQDAKSAVRFFRRYAEQYRIDTSQIFVLGTSAGAYTALNLAYLDESEVPFFIDLDKLGGLEGQSGNPGYPSTVHGVVSMWGALPDTSWIQAGNPPLIGIHGTADTVVPYSFGLLGGLPQYGSVTLAARAAGLDIRSDVFLFNGAGHSLDDDKGLLDSAFRVGARFLYSILDCNSEPTTDVPAPVAAAGAAPVVFPHPVSDKSLVRFVLPVSQHITVALYDALGRELAVVFGGAASGELSIPLERRMFPAPGVYYCRLRTVDRVYTVPVVVR